MTGEAPAGDLVDTAGSTGGLEELAEAWRFLGVVSQRTTALRDISALTIIPVT